MTAMTQRWVLQCSLASARGFMDNCWSWLGTADTKDPVMCTINSISGWPQVWALTDILLQLNPMIASSFISPVSTWLSIDTNKTIRNMVLFYSSSQTVSRFQHQDVSLILQQQLHLLSLSQYYCYLDVAGLFIYF